MTQYFTTHKISVRNGIGKDEALDLVLDRIATYISADNWGEHSDATLGAWTLEWTHASIDARRNNLWVYTIESGEDGNVVDAFYTYLDALIHIPSYVLEESALTPEQESAVALAKIVAEMIGGKVECDFENHNIIFEDFTSCCDSDEEMWNELMAMKTGIELYINGQSKR